MKLFKYLSIALLLLAPAQANAALQKAEVHKGIDLPDGYWALNTLNMDVPSQAAYVTIALYADGDSYLADPTGNKLRDYDTGFTIGGADYQTIFNPTHSVQQIVGDIWVYIKAYRPAPDEPAPFGAAEIVP